MRSPEAPIRINETRYVERHKITAEALAIKIVIPGPTADHEARHIVAARANGTGVEMATIVPGPGYLGKTKLDRPDPIAAAAPHATGCDGTGHDMAIVAFMGHDARAASNAARSIIYSNDKEKDAVATLLEERQTVHGHEIDHAIRNARKATQQVRIIVENLEDGGIQTEKAIASEGVVIFQSKWIKDKELATAA